jgi:hypothetical protein
MFAIYMNFYDFLKKVTTYKIITFSITGASPSLSSALGMAGEEARIWSLAGAKGLSLLTGLGTPNGGN